MVLDILCSSMLGLLWVCSYSLTILALFSAPLIMLVNFNSLGNRPSIDKSFSLVLVKDLSLISYRIVDIGLYMLLPYQHSFSLVLSVLHQEFSSMLLVQLIG